ncbi:hypothetical protein A3G53_02165 [Candidatus Nomurabacteria bacterium RIFCSPLOWO2_12_FULL_44_11]|uniref:Phosphoribosyltransferase domain-containing protein n=1 Tax=Candidatus Nomurabacteria bacterium RIFCSPLOWO2_12_FULL_44_11 TaxID=1801796 RepID=A0A1F6Y720_9BACT|nr:MAG: hypothetical protein A3E95_00915 [Candidatus Nomurabacteria bacterium RIFCSPHIGHO2_12_FULL_44_22b]OGJ02174.1 MAG: hypothetical protein A3G53_02165 [Candidatus Nomurabacteria bacterium RIFCSPLOWO2_12_FULL_44_11]
MRLLGTILDIILPVYCLSCGAKGVDLCAECLTECPAAERESAKWITPLYDYRHPKVKRAVWLLKYRGRRKLASIFAGALYGRILEELSDLSIMENFKDALLVPIPLSGKRYRERGFNQAELICRELVKLDREENLKLDSGILIKPKDTIHQAHIENRNARIKNIVGSFAVKNIERIKNRNIILIDDVTTTGATLAEARKIMKSYGARKIIAFTIAH